MIQSNSKEELSSGCTLKKMPANTVNMKNSKDLLKDTVRSLTILSTLKKLLLQKKK